MPKFSQIPTNNAPALTDFQIGVTSGGVDYKATLAQLAALVSANLTNASVTPAKWTNPYKADAYLSSSLGIAANTWTKATLNTESFDTNNDFNNSSLYRYVAPVNGFYLVAYNIGLSDAGMSGGYAEGAMYKNGAAIISGSKNTASGSATSIPRDSGARLLYLVAGDYLEVWGYINEGGRSIAGGTNMTFLSVILESLT